MDTIRILEKIEGLNWEYDEEADVLYLSVGPPKQAVGIDIGKGLVVRYDESAREIVGLTVIGLRERTLKELTETAG